MFTFQIAIQVKLSITVSILFFCNYCRIIIFKENYIFYWGFPWRICWFHHLFINWFLPIICAILWRIIKHLNWRIEWSDVYWICWNDVEDAHSRPAIFTRWAFLLWTLEGSFYFSLKSSFSNIKTILIKKEGLIRLIKVNIDLFIYIISETILQLLQSVDIGKEEKDMIARH